MLKYPNLFSPITLRGVTYSNRIFSAPMTFRDLPGEGELTPEAAAFYELRAQGGAAEVTVSELTVHGKTGRTYPNNTAADTPFVKVGLAVAADSIRRHGAVPCVEFTGANMPSCRNCGVRARTRSLTEGLFLGWTAQR